MGTFPSRAPPTHGALRERVSQGNIPLPISRKFAAPKGRHSSHKWEGACLPLSGARDGCNIQTLLGQPHVWRRDYRALRQFESVCLGGAPLAAKPTTESPAVLASPGAHRPEGKKDSRDGWGGRVEGSVSWCVPPQAGGEHIPRPRPRPGVRVVLLLVSQFPRSHDTSVMETPCHEGGNKGGNNSQGLGVLFSKSNKLVAPSRHTGPRSMARLAQQVCNFLLSQTKVSQVQYKSLHSPRILSPPPTKNSMQAMQRHEAPATSSSASESSTLLLPIGGRSQSSASQPKAKIAHPTDKPQLTTANHS